MKRKLVVAAVLAAALGSWTPSWAFQSVQKATVTASVTTGGALISRFSFNIRTTSQPLGPNLPTTTPLGWSGVDPLSTSWKLSDNLIVMNSTVTDVGGGIQMYTDNTAADANPRFVDPTPADPTNPDSNAAGLLKVEGPTTSSTLSMAWTIKSNPRIIESGTDLTGVGAADPNNGATTAVYNNKFQWLFITDKFNTAGIDNNQNGNVTDPTDTAPFVNGAAYITIRKAAGIHFGQQASEFGAVPQGSDNYIYYEANFAGAATQQLYRTTALRIEAFLQ